MKVFLDMDGVVADFVNGAYNHHWDLMDSRFLTDRGDRAWDILQYFDGYPADFWGSLTKSFWANLNKMHDADDIFDACASRFGRENICFLSSPCYTDGCCEGKRQWVNKHYPGVPLLLSVSAKGGLPPKHFVAGPESILIDDHPPNIDAWQGPAFLYPRRWNHMHNQTKPVVALQNFLGLMQSVNADLHQGSADG